MLGLTDSKGGRAESARKLMEKVLLMNAIFIDTKSK
jgi:hypothetical protein